MGYNNNNQGYRNNNFPNQQAAQKPIFKKSGFEAKLLRDGDNEGMPICYGWRKTRMGIQKMYARPYSKSKISTSKNGNDFCNLFVTLTSDAGVIKTSGLYSFKSDTLIINELGLIGSKKGSGRTASGKQVYGFFGKISKR